MRAKPADRPSAPVFEWEPGRATDRPWKAETRPYGVVTVKRRSLAGSGEVCVARFADGSRAWACDGANVREALSKLAARVSGVDASWAMGGPVDVVVYDRTGDLGPRVIAGSGDSTGAAIEAALERGWGS